jgi:hypothetical protein
VVSPACDEPQHHAEKSQEDRPLTVGRVCQLVPAKSVMRTSRLPRENAVQSTSPVVDSFSDESGVSEVFIQSFPVPGNKRRVSTAGGSEPKWRRDGKELFYLAADRSLMAVDVTTGQSLDVGVPKVLFPTHTNDAGGRNRYAVSGDGQRFLIESRVSQPASTSITVVLNWPTALLLL